MILASKECSQRAKSEDQEAPIQTVSLSFFRFNGIGARLWAFAQMGFARRPLARTPDLAFWKLFGSGTGEGFTPVPNTGVYAILGVWPSERIARQRISESPLFTRYQRRATEACTLYLATASVRGAWDGTAPFETVQTVVEGPLAALTRATVRPRIALQFWRRVPSISRAIGADRNVAFKIGLGEVPWFQQVTFSIWPDRASMADFARADGPHARAIQAVRRGQWFKEELYARFRILDTQGTWDGEAPLRRLDPSRLNPTKG